MRLLGRQLSQVLARYKAFAWLLILVVPAIWALDRSPSIRVTGDIATLVATQGSTGLISVPVSRELWRDCSTQFRKVLVDAAGVRFDFGVEQEISHEAMAEVERRLGPFLKGSIQVPDVAAVGMGRILIDARFICNPLHRIWPIERTVTVPIIITPRPKK